MNKLSESLSGLKESLSFYTEEDISKLSETELVDYANQWISDLEFENSLYRFAIANNITGAEFEKWATLAADKYNQLQEGEEINEDELLALVNQSKN